MTKNSIKSILLSAGLFAVASVSLGTGVSDINVTISDAAGRLTYRGKTDANGVFSSGPVAPGNYVVQFHGKNATASRNDYAIFAAAGHQRVVADAVPGAKFASNGVAVRLKPTVETPIVGQIALGGLNALGTKIINGVRYVLLPPETGDAGPRWVQEGTTSGRNVTRIRIDDPGMIKPPGGFNAAR
ncbi:MAG: carboxypeptidase-like regulatory domain-containing protein [Chthoniobacterales bacterium]